MRTRLGCWVWPGSGRPRATIEPRGAADRPRPGSDPGQGRLVSTREATGPGRRAGRPGGVRVLEGAPEVGRRGFLQAAAVQGASLPVACVLLGRDARAAAVADAGPAAAAARRKGALRLPPGEAPAATIVRDFADPYLELLRLLREAAEIEHSLLVQYLYGAFSLKPAYEAVAGRGDPNAHDLLGVAIQEMQHLRAVNRLLVALGAAPHLDRQDFPYEPDIYPFALNLEPLGRASLAKYVYTEAPGDALHFRAARTEDDFIFLQDLHEELGDGVRPNHVGSLYGTVIEVLAELGRSPAGPPLPDLERWTGELERIKGEGEVDHFRFFRDLFTGRHEGFGGVPQVWRLDADDPAYPAYRLPVNPTAYVGHPRQIEDPAALTLAWLGNLHYWAALAMLDYGYRDDRDAGAAAAQACMLGPLWSLGRHLPRLGAGMPFDPLGVGYAPGRTGRDSLRFVVRLLREADRLARSVEADLPPDYPLEADAELVAELEGEIATTTYASSTN